MDDASQDRGPQDRGWRGVPALWVAVALLAFATGAGLWGGWTSPWLAILVRDPASTYEFPAYVGLLSHLGVIAMTCAAAVALFAGWVVGRGAAGGTVLLAVGALSGVLVLDDVFMLHEEASRLGEVAIFLFFGLCALFIARGVRRLPGAWDMRGLKLAIGLMALSVLADVFKIYGPFAYWLEDFPKLAGFGAWAAHWAGFARTAIARR